MSFENFNESTLAVEKKTQNTFSAVNLILVKTNAVTFTLLPLANFKRLPTLSTINRKYSTKDLNSDAALTPGSGQMALFDTSKAFTCSSNKFLSKKC